MLPTGHRRSRALRALLAAVLVLAGGPAAAVQRDYVFEGVGREQGLGQSTVHAIAQDRIGYLWVGSESGLYRYDGRHFVRFDGHQAGQPDLSGVVVTSLAVDGAGRLWAGLLTHGLVRLDPASEGAWYTPSGVEPGLRAINVQALAFDGRDALWVADDAGLRAVSTDDGATLRRVASPQVDGAPADITALRATADGALWVGTTTGVWRLAAGAGELERLPETRNAYAFHASADGTVYAGTSDGLIALGADGSTRSVWSAREAAVRAIGEDVHGRLWLAVSGQGLVVVDPKTAAVRLLGPNRALPGYLPDTTIRSLAVDRSGLLWIGMRAHGLLRVTPDGAPLPYIADLDESRAFAPTNNIRALLEGGDGQLWIGTEGDGLKRYDPQSGRFAYYLKPLLDSLRPQSSSGRLRVNRLADAGDGRVLVASEYGLSLFDPKTGSATTITLAEETRRKTRTVDVLSVLRASDGRIWYGTRSGSLARGDLTGEGWQVFDDPPDPAAPHARNSVFALFEDRQGRVWAGTLDGLRLIDPASGHVRAFRYVPGDPRSLSNNIVRSLLEDHDGRLWVGTHGGLDRLDTLGETSARFTRWTREEGLPDDTVYALLEDPLGRVWLSTNRGLTWYDRASGTFHTLSAGDGLQDLEFNGGAALRLRDGRMAFGGLRGFNLFPPAKITASRYEAPVVITGVRVGAQPRVDTIAGPVQMHHADGMVHFSFATLDFAASANRRLSYRLEGFDAGWVDAGEQSEAIYANLDPGHYRFRVRATDRPGGHEGPQAEADLVVEAPWWASDLAKLVYALSAAGLIALALALRASRNAAIRHHHQELREREDRLRMVLWGSGDEFWDWNIPRGVLIRFGSRLLMNGNPQDEIPIDRWQQQSVHPDDLQGMRERVRAHLEGETEIYESEHRLRRRNGDWIWVMARGKVVERDGAGRPLRLCGTARDITHSRAADRERRIALEVIRSMSEAVVVTDLQSRFVSVNPAFTQMTGWREEEVVDRPTSILDCSQHTTEFYEELRATQARTGHWNGELWQRRKDGSEFLCLLQLSEVCDADGVRTHYVGVLTDITDRKRSEQELRYLANYDMLTGLPNRSLLSERLAHAIVRSRRSGRKVAVLFLDLDRFKHVNDSMGHAAGDRLLKAAGARLRRIVRDSDTVARHGGDEFTVVLDIVDFHEAERVAQKIISAFSQPLELGNGQDVVISPSIGISLYPDHGQFSVDLLKYADTAMYQSKERGRNTYMFYTEAMDASTRMRATLVGALRKAIERGELHLLYQPKLSLLDDRITGVEALLRWNSEELGLISPSEFIPIAEETGMIVEVGEWVLREACAQLTRWRDAGIEDIGMSVNVSVLQLLRGELPQRLCDILAEFDVAPNRFELELTESMVMANAEQSITTLRQLKTVGVTLAIDDFGTGYSSLAYLKRLPIDTLKIDKAFVGDITTDPDDEAITATIINMAHSLGLNVVAEGVESAEQIEYLREQGCDEVQGHWLSWPLTQDACLEFLRARPARRGVEAPGWG